MTTVTFYRFTLDGRAVAPWRRTFDEAAADAINAGYAVRHGEEVRLDAAQGAAVERSSPGGAGR